MALPTNVSHKIIPYNDTDPIDSFILSDHDLMKANANNRSTEANQLKHVPVEAPKQRKSVVLCMSLPSSAYATMALREVLIGSDEGEDLPPISQKRKLSPEESVPENDVVKKPNVEAEVDVEVPVPLEV